MFCKACGKLHLNKKNCKYWCDVCNSKINIDRCYDEAMNKTFLYREIHNVFIKARSIKKNKLATRAINVAKKIYCFDTYHKWLHNINFNYFEDGTIYLKLFHYNVCNCFFILESSDREGCNVFCPGCQTRLRLDKCLI